MHASWLISKCTAAAFGSGALLAMAGCQSPPRDPPRAEFGSFFPFGNATPDPAVVTEVRGSVRFSQPGKRWSLLEEKQLLVPGSVIQCGFEGEAHLALAGNTLDLLAFNDTTVILRCVQVARIETNSVVDVTLRLASGIVQGEIRTPSQFSIYQVITPNAVFFVPGLAKARFQIGVNGLAHMIEGSMTVVYIHPATWKLYTYTVNAGQSFAPPVNSGRAEPIIRSTSEGELQRESERL